MHYFEHTLLYACTTSANRTELQTISVNASTPCFFIDERYQARESAVVEFDCTDTFNGHLHIPFSCLWHTGTPVNRRRRSRKNSACLISSM